MEKPEKASETVEEYAAELKRLYDKAHKDRDRRTRQQDLLRRFLDGLLDNKARFQVEFVKTPDSIDDAVYEVVSYLSYHEGRSSRPARAVKTADIETESAESASETSNSDQEETRAARTGRERAKAGKI